MILVRDGKLVYTVTGKMQLCPGCGCNEIICGGCANTGNVGPPQIQVDLYDFEVRLPNNCNDGNNCTMLNGSYVLDFVGQDGIGQCYWYLDGAFSVCNNGSCAGACTATCNGFLAGLPVPFTCGSIAVVVYNTGNIGVVISLDTNAGDSCCDHMGWAYTGSADTDCMWVDRDLGEPSVQPVWACLRAFAGFNQAHANITAL